MEKNRWILSNEKDWEGRREKKRYLKRLESIWVWFKRMTFLLYFLMKKLTCKDLSSMCTCKIWWREDMFCDFYEEKPTNLALQKNVFFVYHRVIPFMLLVHNIFTYSFYTWNFASTC
jgi:hypothetical protein